MSRKYKIRNQESLYFVSFATVYWIDLFVRPIYNELLLDSLKFCQKNKGLQIYGWCFMPSHLHLIVSTDNRPIQNILRDFKSVTSRKLKEEIKQNPQESRKSWIIWMMERAGMKNGNNGNWQLWQQHNQPIELDTNIMMDRRLDYLHNNPVEAGFVHEPEDWKYSSAVDYAGGKGLLDILIIE